MRLRVGVAGIVAVAAGGGVTFAAKPDPGPIEFAQVVEISATGNPRLLDLTAACYVKPAAGPCYLDLFTDKGFPGRPARRIGHAKLTVRPGAERRVRMRLRSPYATVGALLHTEIAAHDRRGSFGDQFISSLRVRAHHTRPDLPFDRPALRFAGFLDPGGRTLQLLGNLPSGCSSLVRRTALYERDGEVAVRVDVQQSEPPAGAECSNQGGPVCLSVPLETPLRRRSVVDLGDDDRNGLPDLAQIAAADAAIDDAADAVRAGRVACTVLPAGPGGVFSVAIRLG